MSVVRIPGPPELAMPCSETPVALNYALVTRPSLQVRDPVEIVVDPW